MIEEYRFVIGVVVAIVVVGLFIYGVLDLAKTTSKMRLAKNEFNKEQELRFNACVDQVLLGDIKRAKDIYNEMNNDNKKAFLNGLIIGLDIEENKLRLMQNKYEL